MPRDPPRVVPRDRPVTSATVERLLKLDKDGNRPASGTAAIARGDIVPAREAIAAMRGHLAAGRVGQALELAGQELAGERYNETLRRLAMAMTAEPRLAAPLVARVEDTSAKRRLPVPVAALYLLACHRQSRHARLDIASPLLWTAGVRWLFDHVRPEGLHAIAGRVLKAHPDQRFLARLHEATGLVPGAVEGDRFIDRLDACAQLVRTTHAAPQGLLVCLCGYHGRMGVPLNFLHRWVSRLPWHVLYLRDLRQRHYRDGVPVFGTTPEATEEAIRRIADGLGVGRLAFYGSSMGGMVAVLMGQRLGAERCLSAAGTADVSPRDGRERLPQDEQIAITREEAARTAALLRGGVHGRIALLHGAGHARDALYATALRDIDGVDVVTLGELDRHNIDFHLVMTGRYDRVFAWLAGERDELDLEG